MLRPALLTAPTLFPITHRGELLQWDLSADGKFTSTILGGAAADGQHHTRVVFGLVGFQAEPARELLLSTSMDRDVRLFQSYEAYPLLACWYF